MNEDDGSDMSELLAEEDLTKLKRFRASESPHDPDVNKLKGYRKRWADRDRASRPSTSLTSEVASPSPSVVGGFTDQIFEQMRKKQKVIVMPWESGLYSQIFGNIVPSIYRSVPEQGYVPDPSMNVRQPEPSPRDEPTTLTTTFKWRIQSKDSLPDYELQSKAKRLAALGKWRRVLEWCQGESQLVWMFPKSLHLEDTEVLNSLEDIFGAKATSTLNKRASAMLQYVNWASMRGHEPIFPMEEKQAYEYVKVLNATAGATVSMSFREALNFCKHVVGMEGVDKPLQSKRIQGACLRQLTAKGPAKQASPFTYDQLVFLEGLVLDREGTYDALAAGTILVTVLGRCRWSDLNYVHVVSLEDPQIMELGTFEHKTAGLQGRKGRLLPILVPIFCFGPRSWVKSWQHTAVFFGQDWNRSPLGPLLPVLNSEETLGAVPVTSADITKFLQSCLQAEPHQRLSSHSGKATLLSWAAKFGLPLETREILGRHSRSASTTAAIYSRDLQGHAIEGLMSVLHAVRSGRFNPEVCRSQRWTQEAIEVKDESDSEHGDGELSEISISESSDSSGEDFFDEEPALLSETTALLFANVKSQILHAKSSFEDAHFKCGTPVTDKFVQTSDEAKAYHPQCQRCFREQ